MANYDKLKLGMIVALGLANVLQAQSDCSKNNGCGTWVSQGQRGGCGASYDACHWVECNSPCGSGGAYNDRCDHSVYCF